MTRSPGPEHRDPFFDNAKFLLVVLVALGHGWEQIISGTHALRAVHTVVYAFHMPAFILLCGYFSRRFSARPDQIHRLISAVLIPYLLFETIYSAVYSVVRDQPFAVTPTQPTYLCWFLLALFIWRLSTPVWRAIRHPLATAALISLAAGLTTMSYDLALPRVLMFLPWFVLGLRLRPGHFQMLHTTAARRCAVPLLGLAGAGAYLLAPSPDDHWLSMDATCGELGVTWGQYLVARIGLFALSAVLVAAFLALVPRRRTSFTALGAFTMYPYLVHGLLIRAGEGAGVYVRLQTSGLIGQVVLSASLIVAVVLLSTSPIRRLLRPVVEPSLSPPLLGWRGRRAPRGAQQEHV